MTMNKFTFGTPYNFMMFGRELRLPDSLIYDTPGQEDTPTQEYAANLLEQMEVAREVLRARQKEIQTKDNPELLLFKVGDQVWLDNRRRRRGKNPKLQPKYVGPFEVTACRNNHMYHIGQGQQRSWQNERRLELL